MTFICCTGSIGGSRFTGRLCLSIVISRMVSTACYAYTLVLTIHINVYIYIYIYIYVLVSTSTSVVFWGDVFSTLWRQVSICFAIYLIPVALGMGGWGYFKQHNLTVSLNQTLRKWFGMCWFLITDRQMLLSVTTSNLSICILGGIHGPQVSMHQVILALLVTSRERTCANIAHED